MTANTDFNELVANAFLAELRHNLADSVEKVRHCVGQLSPEDLAFRPSEGQNSITNLILHLCGNVRQWVVSGVGGAPDVRDRPAEFSDHSAIPARDLLARLQEAVDAADAAMARLRAADLLLPRRIQGFDTTVLSAIVDSVAHFRGHAQEIICLTRMRLGDRYRFLFVPQGKEQGAPA